MPRANQLTREESLRARPVAAVVLHREPLPDGGQRLTVPFQPTGLQKYLVRNTDGMTKKFELDPLGVAVLGMCDGTKSVRHIVDAFAKKHRLHPAEAERAVATFLQTMMKKGLVAMAIE